jgi:hypothetical protein
MVLLQSITAGDWLGETVTNAAFADSNKTNNTPHCIVLNVHHIEQQFEQNWQNLK